MKYYSFDSNVENKYKSNCKSSTMQGNKDENLNEEKPDKFWKELLKK
jgi:hypothetical protein